MNESNLFGVSVRAIMAFVIVVSCCGLAIFMQDMPVLKELALIATGYLFGKQQSTGDKQNEKVDNSSGIINTNTGKS